MKNALSDREQIGEFVPSYLEQMESRLNGLETPRVPTGFIDLDWMLDGGFLPGDLYVVAGEPAMGKTLLAMNIAADISVNAGHPVVCFSLNMGKKHFMDRMVAALTGIRLKKLRQAELTNDELEIVNDCCGKIKTAPLYLNVNSEITILQIHEMIKALSSTQRPHLAVIDDIQFLSSGDNPAAVAETCRQLKNMALELQIPFLAVSRLAGNMNERMNGYPKLSDLRGTGVIEDTVDAVMFVHRDYIYSENPESKDTISVIFARNNVGHTGEVNMKCDVECAWLSCLGA
ncbi:MAG: DnaB-like helicase C-terminal domain-containing protein [Deltaproteobacteria bacterium]|nr:DnaB-like helicase C-terminal domain-containing protein [Deltaproteobacteria bacterium]